MLFSFSNGINPSFLRLDFNPTNFRAQWLKDRAADRLRYTVLITISNSIYRIEYTANTQLAELLYTKRRLIWQRL
jgi:hypothetical protein